MFQIFVTIIIIVGCHCQPKDGGRAPDIGTAHGCSHFKSLLDRLNGETWAVVSAVRK